MVIFSTTPLDIIQKEIIQYAENNGYNKNVYDRINIILIENPLAFCSINWISRVSIDSMDISEFLDAFANWLEFFSDFTNQYRDIKRKIGIDYFKPKKKGKYIPPPPPPPEYELTSEEQTCLNLLSNLFHRRKFSPTGRMNKTTIQNFIADHSLGITDLEKYFELMERSEIIEKITKAQVAFSSKIINASSLDELKQRVINFFQRLSQKGSSMSNFI